MDCDSRGIEIGMWRMCLNPLQEQAEHDHHGQHQVIRNWTETGEVCKTILVGRGTNIPRNDQAEICNVSM